MSLCWLLILRTNTETFAKNVHRDIRKECPQRHSQRMCVTETFAKNVCYNDTKDNQVTTATTSSAERQTRKEQKQEFGR